MGGGGEGKERRRAGRSREIQFSEHPCQSGLHTDVESSDLDRVRSEMWPQLFGGCQVEKQSERAWSPSPQKKLQWVSGYRAHYLQSWELKQQRIFFPVHQEHTDTNPSEGDGDTEVRQLRSGGFHHWESKATNVPVSLSSITPPPPI